MNPIGVAPSAVVPYSNSLAASPASPIISGVNPPGIVYTCDATIDATMPGTCNFLNTTIAGIYGNTFSNASASIYIKYGTTGLGASLQYLNFVTYNSYLTSLTAHSSGDAVDTAALASLPNTEPAVFNAGNIWLTDALLTAFGAG